MYESHCIATGDAHSYSEWLENVWFRNYDLCWLYRTELYISLSLQEITIIDLTSVSLALTCCEVQLKIEMCFVAGEREEERR